MFAKEKAFLIFLDWCNVRNIQWLSNCLCTLALSTASYRNLSCHPFSSTPASLTCQPPSPESMHVLTILQSRMLTVIGKQWKGCWARTWQPYVNNFRLGCQSSAPQKRCLQSSTLPTRMLNVRGKSTSTTKPCPSAPSPNTSE